MITKNIYRLIFILLFCITVAFIVYTIIVIDSDLEMKNPLLPDYTVFYMRGSMINISVIFALGLIPAIVFWILKYYKVAICCLLIIEIAGFLMKDSLKFYEYF